MSENPGDEIAGRFRRLIRLTGPMTVARFMGEANAHYYATRDPLGSAGDFTTAPEISQMFGELAGLWLAELWHRAGRPAGAIYCELGPGRGTLARDALRAMAQAGCRPEVHLVEASPALRAKQAESLPGALFHHDPAALPSDRPLLLLANEFLDALPIRQLVRAETGWRERMVGLAGDDFAFVSGVQPMDEAVPSPAREAELGTIIETNPGAAAVVAHLAERLAHQGGAALFFDYGHLAPRTGSTLQAVRAHRKVDPLAMPGGADLTAHVDFAVLADIARGAGCQARMASQGEWLAAMGIELRAAALASASPGRRDEVAKASRRLVHADEMGALFKVFAMTAPGWPDGSGFAMDGEKIT